MTLKELLGFIGVVIDDTCVSRTVEDFMARLSSQIVHTLIDVLIESENPLQVESINTIALLLLHFLSEVIVHFVASVGVFVVLTVAHILILVVHIIRKL